MSKVAGIQFGVSQSDPFNIPAGQMGGRDQSVQIQMQNANVTRQEITALTKYVNEKSKSIRKAIRQMEVLADGLVVDKETKLVTMDREFIKDLKDCIKTVKAEYEDMIKAAKNK